MTIKQAYIQLNLEFDQYLYIQSLFGLIQIVSALFGFIIKVIKLSYNELEVSTNHFVTYHLYYNNIVDNLTWTFICGKNCLNLLYYYNNLLTAFFFTHNNSVCISKPGQVTKKRELLRIIIYHSHFFQTLSLFFSLILASLPLLANYSSIKLDIKVSFSLFYTTLTIKFLSDNIVFLKKQL